MARNLDDLRAIVRQLTNKKVQVRFVKENLTFTGDDTAMATFLLSVMGAFAEFERALIRERQREGIALAKKAGVYKSRSRALNDEQAAEVARERTARCMKIVNRCRHFATPHTVPSRDPLTDTLHGIGERPRPEDSLKRAHGVLKGRRRAC